MLYDKSGVHRFFLLLLCMSAFLAVGPSQVLLESKEAEMLLGSLLKANSLKVC